MTLTELQHQTIELYLGALLERAQILRAEGKSAPGEHESHLLFTETATAFDIDQDEEVNLCRAELHGLAIGLGFSSSLDLYVFHRAGFLHQGEHAPAKHLPLVVLQAVALLSTHADPALRALALDLTEALRPDQDRDAFAARGGAPWTSGS